MLGQETTVQCPIFDAQLGAMARLATDALIGKKGREGRMFKVDLQVPEKKVFLWKIFRYIGIGIGKATLEGCATSGKGANGTSIVDCSHRHTNKSLSIFVGSSEFKKNNILSAAHRTTYHLAYHIETNQHHTKPNISIEGKTRSLIP